MAGKPKICESWHHSESVLTLESQIDRDYWAGFTNYQFDIRKSDGRFVAENGDGGTAIVDTFFGDVFLIKHPTEDIRPQYGVERIWGFHFLLTALPRRILIFMRPNENPLDLHVENEQARVAVAELTPTGIDVQKVFLLDDGDYYIKEINDDFFLLHNRFPGLQLNNILCAKPNDPADLTIRVVAEFHSDFSPTYIQMYENRLYFAEINMNHYIEKNVAWTVLKSGLTVFDRESGKCERFKLPKCDYLEQMLMDADEGWWSEASWHRDRLYLHVVTATEAQFFSISMKARQWWLVRFASVRNTHTFCRIQITDDEVLVWRQQVIRNVKPTVEEEELEPGSKRARSRGTKVWLQHFHRLPMGDPETLCNLALRNLRLAYNSRELHLPINFPQEPLFERPIGKVFVEVSESPQLPDWMQPADVLPLPLGQPRINQCENK